MWSHHCWRGSSRTEWYQMEMKKSRLKLTLSKAELRCLRTDNRTVKSVRSLGTILWHSSSASSWIIHSRVSQNGNLEQQCLLLLLSLETVLCRWMMVWLWLLSVLPMGDIRRYTTISITESLSLEKTSKICSEYCKYLLSHHTVPTLHALFREYNQIQGLGS